MYSKITVAVAGTGFIGPVHVEALRRLGISVRGILGSTPEKSAKAARHLGLVKAYTSYTELLQDPEVQAIHIATPNIAHFPMVKDALLAGKHVMCEKPLAMTSTETTELVNLAKTSGLVTGVTYNIRFYPMNLEARQLIHEESVGKIFSISGSYVQDWLLYENDYNWRVSSDKGGALRAVADIGTHWIDLIYSITGLDVEAVCANLTTVHSVRHKPVGEVETFTGSKKDLSRQPISVDTEDCGSILFRYKNGAQGILWVSQVTAGYKNRIRYEIAGSKQSISWDSDKANQLLVGHRDRANEILEKDPGLVSYPTAHFIDYPGGHSEGFPDTFKQCFRAFYDAILDQDKGQHPRYASFEDGHKEVILCEAILESHRSNSWVTI